MQTNPIFKIKKPIVLIGMMGVGKSSIGWRLAQRINVPFIDIDREIEVEQKMLIKDIFEQHGEDFFRRIEKEILLKYLEQEPIVMAAGGGAFMDESIRAIVKEKAISVWLKADIEVILERISRKNTRPLLQKDDKRETLKELIKGRYSKYQQADISMESDGYAHGLIVTKLIGKISEYQDTIQASM